jgi:glucose/arabinose dehydrogenase
MRVYGSLAKGSLLISVALSILGLSNWVLAAPAGLPSGFTATVLQNNSLGTPTSVRVHPTDGRLFVFDLTGTIKIFTPGSGLSATPFATVSVHVSGDRGLLGAAFDSDYTNHPYLYIHYVGADQKVRVGRYNASGPTGTNFQVIYTAPTTADYQHAGGGITVSNDGFVYFGIGDSGTPTRSQDLSNIHGKIHRIGRDGVVPNSNPYFNQSGVQNTIYAHGFRNPFRLTTERQVMYMWVMLVLRPGRR